MVVDAVELEVQPQVFHILPHSVSVVAENQVHSLYARLFKTGEVTLKQSFVGQWAAEICGGGLAGSGGNRTQLVE